MWPATLDPVPGPVVALLRRIDRAAGAEARHLDQTPQLLDRLRDQARIESVTASSAIEGIVVARDRSERIVRGEVRSLRNRSEAELAGYTDALNYLYNEDVGALSVGLITHLHRLTYGRTPGGGGRLKSTDNLVVDRDRDGSRTIRFEPVNAFETPTYLHELAARTDEALRAQRHHPLIVVAACVLDLLCIHPFDDGNGRVARLLTAWLLVESGYGVGRYLSIEQLIYEASDEYYEALARSTHGWFDDGQHSIWPWTTFLLERLAIAYERFEARIGETSGRGSKQDRARRHILQHAAGAFTIADLRRALPGISDATTRVVLNQLRNEGLIGCDGSGRGAVWRRLPPPS